jgi:hypothetical protein
MRVFTCRLSPHLQDLYSMDQHGFCPSRNCSTALLNILACVEATSATSDPVFVMALDVAKAYDSVHRERALTILRHMGVANNKFFDLLWRSLTVGATAVCGGGKLGEPWLSSRGIK